MKKNTIVMLSIILIYGIIYFIFGETVPQNGGFGWDGMVYKMITQNPYETLFINGMIPYYKSRIFVPVLLFSIFKLFGISLTDFNTLWAYKIFNLVALLISIYYYNLIADHFKWKNKVRWIGFCALFVNYATVKQFFYNPVFLDTAIYTIAIIQLYYYLKKNVVGVVITAIAGSLTWPTFLFSSMIMILFPVSDTEEVIKKRKIKNVLIALVLIGYPVIILYSLRYMSKVLFFTESPFTVILLPLSIICLLIYLFFVLNSLLDHNILYDISNYKSSISFKNVIIVVLLFILIYVIITSSYSGGISNIKYVIRMFLLSVKQPFIFIISHIVYYGPVLIITMYYWKNVSRTIHSFGIGLTLISVFYLVFSLDSESRRMINAFPLFVILTMIVINRLEIDIKHVIAFLLLAIIFSKVWFKIGVTQFNESMAGGYQTFPSQRYFMNYGPWMSFDMYILQGTVVILTVISLFFFLRKYYASNRISELNTNPAQVNELVYEKDQELNLK